MRSSQGSAAGRRLPLLFYCRATKQDMLITASTTPNGNCLLGLIRQLRWALARSPLRLPQKFSTSATLRLGVFRHPA